MSNDTNVEAANQWWRWPLVPVASFIGATLAMVVLGLFYWLSIKISGGFSEDGWYYKYVIPLISSGIFGYCFVYFGAKTAPKGKFITAIVMATIIILIVLTALLYHIFGNAHDSLSQTIISCLQCISVGVTAVVGVMVIQDEEGR